MQSEYLINFLNEKNIPLVTKKRKTYITYAGFDQQYTYVLKDGIIKISITQQDGRNFNIDYIQALAGLYKRVLSAQFIAFPASGPIDDYER